MAFIHSKNYFVDIGVHVFPMIKYRLVCEKLLREAGLRASDFVAPRPASFEDLQLVHTREYLDDLRHCRWTSRTAASELPISEKIVELFRLAVGGTILACDQALQSGWAVHLSGGFHHAFADRAEGFCYLNDLAVAVRVLQSKRLTKRVAIIDCDLHQGNGTAALFQNDASVFTFSIHQEDLYPIKESSDLDIHLPVGTTDDAYLEHLHRAIPEIMSEFKPDFVLYQAGADPYEGDQLGSLELTIAGLKQRDTFVFEQCKNNKVPVAVTLGGGYAYDTEDTVRIHYNTCLAALEAYSQSAPQD